MLHIVININTVLLLHTINCRVFPKKKIKKNIKKYEINES